MKKTGWIVLGAVLVLALIMAGSSVSTYNNLVGASERVEKSRSDIQADLQRRSDLIPNLVATVKGFASHEEEILTEIARARSRLIDAGGNMQEAAAADTELTSALSRLLVVVENYPELKANQNFLDLQTQLEGTENRIKVARLKYNEEAAAYNAMLRRFPGNIIAGMGGFERAQYFEASSGAQAVPQVNFEKTE